LRAAETLERRHEGDLAPVLANLARHCAAAVPLMPPETACEYGWRAADQAMQDLAFEEAARLYRLALAANEAAAPEDRHSEVDLLLAIGEAHARGGDGAASNRAYLDAAERVRRTGDAERLAL